MLAGKHVNKIRSTQIYLENYFNVLKFNGKIKLLFFEFQVFDKERTGGIAVSEMRLILSNLPEKLSDEEIDEMLRTADKGGLISEDIFNFIPFRCHIDATRC